MFKNRHFFKWIDERPKTIWEDHNTTGHRANTDDSTGWVSRLGACHQPDNQGSIPGPTGWKERINSINLSLTSTWHLPPTPSLPIWKVKNKYVNLTPSAWMWSRTSRELLKPEDRYWWRYGPSRSTDGKAVVELLCSYCAAQHGGSSRNNKATVWPQSAHLKNWSWIQVSESHTYECLCLRRLRQSKAKCN